MGTSEQSEFGLGCIMDDPDERDLTLNEFIDKE